MYTHTYIYNTSVRHPHRGPRPDGLAELRQGPVSRSEVMINRDIIVMINRYINSDI